MDLHSREKKGVALLVLICVGLMIANLYLGQIYQSPPIQYEVKKDTNDFELKKEPIRFYFNPNTISKDSLLLIGVSEVLANQWVNYRRKVKPFQSVNDLKKLYAMTDTLLEELKPLLQWKDKSDNKGEQNKRAEKEVQVEQTKPAQPTKIIVIDLNSAEVSTLKSLKGIGEAYASRIIKYRDLLGGYANKEQVREVYGISDSLFNSISNQISVETLDVKQVNINTVEIKTLAKHPYINWSVAQSVVNFRQMHGCYQQLSDIMQSDLVNENLYNKIAPYLKADSCLSQPD